MDIQPWVWLTTIGVTVAVLAVDIFVIGRRPHEPSMKECARAIAGYCALAVVFGLGIWLFQGGDFAGQFFAGWVTEYSLSVDNLFVFVILMTRLAVPRELQQAALLIGIVLALVFRGLFIAAGTAVIHYFGWVFYLFGAFLIYTAVVLARQGEDDDNDYQDNAVLRFVKRRFPMSDDYNGAKLTVVQDGKRLLTPMLIVIVALGTTDILFALDSIPAIFGLTKEPYLVFTANVFALMGLRQLYFLVGGLLNRLVYLSLGLSVILGFIGVKLILEALYDNTVPFINGGEPLHWLPTVPIWLSLAVIVVTLAVTTVASILKVRRDPDAVKELPTSTP